MRPAHAVRAEALSLRAECSIVDGNVAAAVRQYLQVADGFGRLPAAQNALFAAARLEAERGRRDRAAELFARYLARYPHGSLADDAARRLGALGGDARAR
jgi:TolA-binding protein